MTPVDPATWRDRIRGCLLGGALGDAIGAPFEGWATVDAEPLDRHLASSTALTWTDDTALQVATAEYLADLEASSSFDDDTHARALAAAWERDPERGYGPNPPYLFRTVLSGGDWRAAAMESFGGTGSLGNGGAMRAAPVGALTADIGVVARLARRMAAVTHAHPVGQDGAALIAVATSLALRVPPGDTVDGEGLVAHCLSELDTPTVRETVALVPGTIGSHGPEETARLTGNGVAAHEAVSASLAAFLHHPGDAVAAIRFAVRMGGDVDTIAAMAGSIAGAATGAGSLPDGLLRRLEGRADIERVADRLAERTPPD